ncbi:MAG: hypothetical protein IH987_00490 [Planctomycetes bacterium]|nr:hypothetical protein [Planctomycetota bacterium]
MKGIVLFDDRGFSDLLPLTLWRSIGELRLGRKLLLDRTAQRLGLPIVGIWSHAWLAAVAAHRCGAPANKPIEEGGVLVNSRWLVDETPEFSPSPHVGVVGDEVAFVVVDRKLADGLRPNDFLDHSAEEEALSGLPRMEVGGRMIRYPWDIIGHVGELLVQDWRSSEAVIESELDARVLLVGKDSIHIAQNVTIHPTAVIDGSFGPVYISHDVLIGPYVVLEGPAYIGPGTRVNPHAYLHGGVGIGPMCKIGGEIDTCILDGYANKQHSGFLGHAYVGSWVNIGAGAENSDLKNTYSTVRVPIGGSEVDTGTLFFGCVIGDHAKIGINASIPTGAVIGFAAMIATTRLLPKFVPSFGWLTEDGLATGKVDLMLDAATRMMVRRNVDMTDEEVELFLENGDRAKALEGGRSRTAP